MADALIRLCGLWKNRSQKTGEVYYAGVLGGAKVLLLRDKKAAEGAPQWALMISERPAKPASDERRCTLPRQAYYSAGNVH
ncbi:MAG TPA: hypothetical protein PLQ12_08660 [Candidatus Defluviicoccus seviourii]|nr:hypothetical protein [Candidatus Defluviicoccus seviourii]